MTAMAQTFLHPFLIAGNRGSCPCCPVHNCALREKQGRFGIFYGCPHFPVCDMCANRSDYDNRWRLSTQAIRNERHAAHAAFDELWRGHLMKRGAAYRWLGEQLGLPRHQNHIQHLTEAGCREVVRLATAKLDELRSEVK